MLDISGNISPSLTLFPLLTIHPSPFPLPVFTLLYLARLNPSVDQSEIKNLQTHQTAIEEALAETFFRLDSLHLVVVEN